MPFPRRLFPLATAVAMAFGSQIGPVAAAEAGSGVAFLDDRELVVSLEPGVTKAIQVWVVNGGPTAQIISLLITSADGPDGATPLALTTPIGNDKVIAKSAVVGPGGIWSPTLTLSGDSEPGAYSARLAAIGGDGSHAFRDVKVMIDEAPKPDGGDAQVFAEPLPDPLTMHAERSPLAAFQAGQLGSPVSLMLAPEIASTRTVGPLIDDRGRVALASMATDGTLTIISTPGAGTFKGTLGKPDPDGEPTKLTTLTLTVRDFVLWPVLILIVGLALAFLVEDWFTKRAPRHLLDARLVEIIEQSAKQAVESAEELSLVEPWFGPNRLPIAIWEPDPPSGLLAKTRTQALADFDETPTPAKRDERWGAQGTELAKVRGYLESQIELGYLAIGANHAHKEVIENLGQRDGQYEASPIAIETRASLGGGRIDDVGRLQKLIADRRSIGERVGKAAELARILKRLEKKLPKQSSEVEALMERLSDMPRGAIDEINAIAKSANDLWDRAASGQFTDEIIETELDPENLDSLAWAFESFFGVDTGGGYGESVSIERTSEEIRNGLSRNNLVFSGVTALFVIVAALGTQYLANPAFGSESDYAALFVWSFSATAVAQLVKYAASTVRFPARPEPEVGEV